MGTRIHCISRTALHTIASVHDCIGTRLAFFWCRHVNVKLALKSTTDAEAKRNYHAVHWSAKPKPTKPRPKPSHESNPRPNPYPRPAPTPNPTQGQ